MDPHRILDGLNPEQRQAAESVRGPVCVLAGAGTGKTTTITRRIAYQVATGTFGAAEILAVTFTDRAAREMRSRLEALGVSGVRARTFHATALAQLHHFVPQTGQILSSKAIVLGPLVRSLHRAFRSRPLAEIATEIEWAKNRRVTPDRYLDELDGHRPPVPEDVMLRIYRGYEERKRRAGRLDFEDVLEHLVRVYESDPSACKRFRARCGAITVDEYQDVNLLQQALLDLWLGDRDELCAVGDDYQAIFAFTGATPEYLLGMPSRYPGARVIRLEENYRSTPEVLELANRLAPALGGAAKALRAARAPGPEPQFELCATRQAEVAWVVERVRAIRQQGVPDEEIAVLLRVNARSDDLEGPLAEAGIPYQVRGGSFLERPAVRAVVRLLRRVADESAGEAVRAAAEQAGLLDEISDDLGEEGVTFQEDLRRLVVLAAGHDGPAGGFVADLRARFESDGEGRGVQLLTYHRAKGLEFEAVLLPFLQAGELPIRQAKTEDAVAEERRLLYVGLTRAKRWLFLSASLDRPRSPFLAELRAHGSAGGQSAGSHPPSPTLNALRAWRRERSKADCVPAYVVFHDSTLAEIAARRPQSRLELAEIAGIGPVKLERYGSEVIDLLRSSPA